MTAEIGTARIEPEGSQVGRYRDCFALSSFESLEVLKGIGIDSCTAADIGCLCTKVYSLGLKRWSLGLAKF